MDPPSGERWNAGCRFGSDIFREGYLARASHRLLMRRGNTIFGGGTSLRYQLQVVVFDVRDLHHLGTRFQEIVPILPHTVIDPISLVYHKVLRAIVVEAASIEPFRHPYFLSIGELDFGRSLRFDRGVRDEGKVARVEQTMGSPWER